MQPGAFWLCISTLLYISLSSAALVKAPSGSWDRFNLAPTKRNIRPSAVRSSSGGITNSQGLLDGTKTTFSGNGASVTLDFGKEVGGLVSFSIDEATSQSSLALSFTESPLFINPSNSDASRAPSGADGVLRLPAPLTPRSVFAQPSSSLRGGFRFLTITSTSSDPIAISALELRITFTPHTDPTTASYTGYFFTNDTTATILNDIWYAGAYTVQTNTISADSAKRHPPPSSGWANDGLGGNAAGDAILVAGAKRDRVIRPADLVVALGTLGVSTHDMVAAKNSISAIFSKQDTQTGSLPFSGPPENKSGSATYICWSLIALHSYWITSGDMDFVQSVWSNHRRAVEFLAQDTDSSGLLNVKQEWSADWGRGVPNVGRSAAVNALYYRVLITSVQLANAVGDTGLASAYTSTSTTLKAAYNSILWDDVAGLYKDTDTSSLRPQDANSYAIAFGLTTSLAQNRRISTALSANWNTFGGVSPELPGTLSPFINGYELRAHFLSSQGTRAIDLLKRHWGHLVSTNTSTQSTFAESVSSSGSLLPIGSSDQSYTSHSASWSTTPTFALTSHLLGIQLTSPQGKTFDLKPILGGLKHAEGGFSTALGFIGISWVVDGGRFRVVTVTPEGAVGVLTPPSSPNRVAAPGDAARLTGSAPAEAVKLESGVQVHEFEI